MVKGRHKKKQSKKLLIFSLVVLIALIATATTLLINKNHVVPTTTTVPTTLAPATVTISAVGDMELGSTPFKTLKKRGKRRLGGGWEGGQPSLGCCQACGKTAVDLKRLSVQIRPTAGKPGPGVYARDIVRS